MLRKLTLFRYLTRLVTADYNEQFIRYLDRVGKIHTPKAGAKSINVEYIHVNALFGYVTDILFNVIMTSSLDEVRISALFSIHSPSSINGNQTHCRYHRIIIDFDNSSNYSL
jgi:hypothetical protein